MSDQLQRLKAALADRYAIQEELGAGGMATVYLAEDLKHHRNVAVKVLRPELAAVVGGDRFLREIEIAARLHHPHILPLYDSGEADGFLYYVMPYVEGESLRDRLIREKQLSLDDALHIAREVADALSYAHGHDVVHRDIKPENILLEAGHAMVADFGIARAITAAGGETLTETGLAVGTPSYMSPEQAAGRKDVDGRSDLYSLACVLYEVIAGQPPFIGPTAGIIVHQHLAVEAPPITNLRPAVPREISATLARALAKTPADRFDPAAQFAEALSGHAASSARGSDSRDLEPHSVAVLPFVNMSPNPENEYFSDGITEELITALCHVKELRVAARTSAFAFKGKDQDVRAIGEALNVKFVLEGSVRQAGNRVRIAAQLVNAADGYHVWSETYDREMEDVFAIQDEISRSIVIELRPTLVGDGDEELVRPHTHDVEAYQLYLKGRFHWNKRTEPDLQKGIEYFEEALRLDPDYALAHVGLADSYNILGFYCALSPKESFPHARAAAERALELDSTVAAAHASRAYVALFHDWQWDEAERGFRKALELNPQYAEANQWLANHLAATRRSEESIATMRQGLEADPLSLIINAALGWMHMFAREYDAARRQLDRTLEMDDRFVPALVWLAMVCEEQGRLDDARRMSERAVEASGGSTHTKAEWARTLAMSGEEAQARNILDDLRDLASRRYVSAFDLAVVHSGLGDIGSALDCLEQAFDERTHWMVFLRGDPRLSVLGAEPRFQQLVTRMEFPPTRTT